MSEIRYTKDHEYIRLDGEIGTVGISPYAQEQLGDVVYVELPAVGASLDKGGQAAVVESVKAASEVYAPAAGEVTEVNADLEATPATVNEDPLGAGWFVKIRVADPAAVSDLMNQADYDTYLKSIS